MKKAWKYGISVLFVALFALSMLCGCGMFGFPPSDNGGESSSGSSSGSSGGNSSGNSGGSSGSGSSGGGQTEKPAPKPEFASGSGTESDPYVISEGYQWANVANHLDAHYLLGADLNLGNLNNLQPIGDSTDPFMGTLDGQNHKIHSAEISSSSNCGLFGVVSGGTLKNINFSDSRLWTGKDGLGSFAGQIKMGTVVENCHAINISCTTKIYGRAGGIVGIVSSASQVRYCSAKASFKTTSNMNHIGGLFGKVEGGSVDACWGIVTASFSSGVWHESGGIVSDFVGGSITNVYAEITFSMLDGGIAHTSEGGCCTKFGLCFNGDSSRTVPLYYEKGVAVTDTTSRYFNSTTIESSNDILDSDEWKDNKLWKKGKLHPELVSYEEYLALTAEA